MIKWIVKKYLNKKHKYLKYQILSLEQELGYADNITVDEQIRLLQIHRNAIWDKNTLEYVINKVI